MGKRTWTDEQLQFVRDNYTEMSHAQMAAHLGKKVSAVKAKCGALGCVNQRHFNAKEVELIKKQYSFMPTQRLAEMIGRSEVSVYNKAHSMGLKKSAEYMEEFGGRIKPGERRGVGTEFKKGQTAFNKGLNINEYMSAEAIEKSKSTRFNKGHIPSNTLHNGAISIRTDTKSGIKYKYIRVSMGEWEMLHIHNYKKAFGEIPEGKIISFKNGDTMNCDPSNLEVITREENLARNSIHRYPDEVKQAIRTVSKLKKKLKDNEKQND